MLMAISVAVPKDLSGIKTKVAMNLMQRESIMIKGHGNVRKRTKKSIGGLPHNKRCIVKK